MPKPNQTHNQYTLLGYLIAATLLILLLQLPLLQHFALWDKHAILAGEAWRVLSGNFTHINGYHLFFNLAGLWIISYLFKSSFQSRQWLLLLFSLSLVIGLSLLASNIHAYLGLSGTLHGLFAFYALHEALQGRKSSWLLALGITVKVVWEQLSGSITGSEALLGATVATEAHLIGTIAGFMFACSSYYCHKITATHR